MKAMRITTLWLALLFIPIAGFGFPNQVQYIIQADLDTSQNVITGHERLLFTNHSGQDLDKLYFNVYPNAFRKGSNSHYQQELQQAGGIFALNQIYANPNDDAFMDILGIKAGDQSLNFTMDDTLMTLNLTQKLPDGASVTLEIEFVYNLMEATSRDLMAFTDAMRSAHRDGVYTVTLWYPKLAVLDQTGWNLEPYSLLGEFYGDFANYDVQLTVPSDFEVGGTGAIESESTTDSKKTLHFLADKVHDFAWIASNRYHVKEVELNGIKIRGFYVDEPFSDLADQAQRVMAYYTDQFGTYANPTFTIAQVTVGGGMEYPGIVMIGQGTTLEISHEIAHQWWYGAIGNNEFKEAWLDEGFATYADENFLMDVDQKLEEVVRSSLNFREPGEIVLEAASAFSSSSTYAAAIYTKGSGILWMLRDFLGSDSFKDLLHSYYSQFEYQNTTTSDFSGYVKKFTGQDLEWFFAQWLKTTKTLDYSIEDVLPISTSGSVSRFSIILRKSGEAIMPVKVEVIPTSGEPPQIVLWSGDKDRDEITVEGISNIQQVLLDPTHRVLEQNRSNDTWVPHQVGALLNIPFYFAIGFIILGCLYSSRKMLKNGLGLSP
ncbi:M1 family metallopeptidase [Candidatus Acetothermia bacterium]|nr:M1 family metallopeptidase [Candidatus Acetothermia bacterium]